MPYTTLISVDELARRRDDSWVIVDCRFALADVEAGRNAYREAHIPKAVYAHLDDDLSGTIIKGVTGRHPLPEIEHVTRRLGALGISNTTQVIAYDAKDGGLAAARLWWILRWLGHDAVAVLDGGFTAWQAAGLPTESGEHNNLPATFVPHVQLNAYVNADEVERMTHDPHVAIVDVRAYVRYAGNEEPIDPVAGHIPNAVSYPYAEIVQASGEIKSTDELRERFAPIADKQIVTYCGSGVTASAAILALEHAGIHGAQLYAGSWSDWITDPKRDIETESTL